MSITGYLKDIFKNPDRYAKFWVAMAGFVVSLLTSYFPTAEWLPHVITFLTAVGVLQVRNK